MNNITFAAIVTHILQMWLSLLVFLSNQNYENFPNLIFLGLIFAVRDNNYNVEKLKLFCLN